MDKTVSSRKLKSVFFFSVSFQVEMVKISFNKNNHFIYLIKENDLFSTQEKMDAMEQTVM